LGDQFDPAFYDQSRWLFLQWFKSSDFEIQHEFVPQTGKSKINIIFTGLKKKKYFNNLII